MLQFYIPEVVAVEQIFDEEDNVQATELKKLEEKLKDEEWNNILSELNPIYHTNLFWVLYQKYIFITIQEYLHNISRKKEFKQYFLGDTLYL